MQAEFDIVINVARKEGSSKPKGWLADAELVFNAGALKGLSLVGFMGPPMHDPGSTASATDPARKARVSQ